MAAPLTGLGRTPKDPPVPRCACCGAPNASRGFPGDVWYLAGHVPPHMRFPWGGGFVAEPVTPAAAAASSQATASLPVAARSSKPPAPDLFAGQAPA